MHWMQCDGWDFVSSVGFSMMHDIQYDAWGLVWDLVQCMGFSIMQSKHNV